MRASGANEKIYAFSHLKTAISFNILLVLQKLCRYTNDILVGLHVPTDFQMYRQNSEKAFFGGIAPPPCPPPPLATLVPVLYYNASKYKAQIA